MLLRAPRIWCTWFSKPKLRWGWKEKDDRARKSLSLESIQLVTTHLVLGAPLHSIPPSVKQFLASDHKTLLLNNQRRFSLGNRMLLGISILACLFVPLMNLLPVQSEILASTRVGASWKGRAPGGMRPGVHVGKGRLSGSSPSSWRLRGKLTCNVWNRHKDMYFRQCKEEEM